MIAAYIIVNYSITCNCSCCSFPLGNDFNDSILACQVFESLLDALDRLHSYAEPMYFDRVWKPTIRRIIFQPAWSALRFKSLT
jgi:hypothetical protein